MIALRMATAADIEAIWKIFHEIIVAGDTNPDDETCTAHQAQQKWLGPDVYTVVVS